MDPIIVLLSEIFNNPGCTREGLSCSLQFDLNVHKLEILIQALLWAESIRQDSDGRFYPTIEKSTFSNVMSEVNLNISAGILIINNNSQALIIHPTMQDKWDIPKGGVQDGEDIIDTAIRETAEEIGFYIDPKFLTYLGSARITNYKTLSLFVVRGIDLDISACTCTSTFQGPDGKDYPEADAFKYVTISELPKYLPEGLSNAITGLINHSS